MDSLALHMLLEQSTNSCGISSSFPYETTLAVALTGSVWIRAQGSECNLGDAVCFLTISYSAWKNSVSARMED
jgi:hypothetical protein